MSDEKETSKISYPTHLNFSFKKNKIKRRWMDSCIFFAVFNSNKMSEWKGGGGFLSSIHPSDRA